jgi:hypothetical protein
MLSEAEVRPKLLLVLEECIERGVRRGYSRAHKYVENPDENAIFESIENCIMSEIYEWFDFEEAQ